MREPEAAQDPIHRAGADRAKPHRLRHLYLLHPHELREPVAQVLILRETELEKLLQVGPELVEARRLGVRAGHAGHDADIELGLVVELDPGRERAHDIAAQATLSGLY